MSAKLYVGLILAAVLLLEVWILGLIVFHPAGGWGADLNTVFTSVVIFSTIPWLLGLVLFLKSFGTSRRAKAATAAIASSSVGPIFAAAALSQYGHAIALILICGWMIKIVLLVPTLIESAREG